MSNIPAHHPDGAGRRLSFDGIITHEFALGDINAAARSRAQRQGGPCARKVDQP